MNLTFIKISEVVDVHVRANFHQVKCSCSRVIVATERKPQLTTILPSLPGIYLGLIFWGTPQSLNSPLKFLAKITFSLLFTIYYYL